MKKKHRDFLGKGLIQATCLISLLITGCIPKSEIVVSLKKNKITTKAQGVDVSNVQIINHQIIITGKNLNSVSSFKIKEGVINTNLQIESQNNTSIVANSVSNVTFAAGKIFDFILSNANGASTFTVDFSLCDSKLGGKGFNCLITPTDKQVLSYDLGTGKWRPRSVNGLNYQGTWSALTALPATGVLIPGDYYIVSVANAPYSVGDWIVLNQDGLTFEQVGNSAAVISVFGRNGNVVGAENDYVLDQLGDVDLSTPPISGDALIFDGSHWVAGAAGGGGVPSGAAGGDLSGTYPNPTIGNNKITDTHIANNAISLTKINGLATSLSGKEPVITGAATTTYFRGDKTFVTLDTSVVPEGSRLYFTNARALGILLAGFDNTLTGQVAATDSMLQAFGRVQNQINSLSSGGSNYLVKNGADTISGTVSLTNVITASGAGDIVVSSVPLTMTSAVNKTYADGKLDKATGGIVAGVVTLDNDLKIKSGVNYVTMKGNPATAADYNFVLPSNAGTAGYLLSTDGSGNTSWVSAGGGGAPTGAATGDLGGSYPAPTVSSVGGVTAANVASGANLANAATNLNTATTIVKRDASGDFSAGTITATLNGTATNVSGTVAVANGGTGATTLGLNQLLFGNGTGVVGTLTTTATPSVLLSAVTTGAPAWTTSTVGNVLKGSITGVVFGPLALSDLPAGILSGAGTVNYVPYYNATNTLANSPIAIDGSKVGIGTTSPGANLELKGTSPMLLIKDTVSGGDSEASFFIEGDDSTGGLSAFSDGFTNVPEWADSFLLYSDQASSGGLRLHANGGNITFGNGWSPKVDRMVILPSGNIGIGTSTPGAPLDVKGAIRMSGATSGYTGFQPAAAAGSTVWTLPAADGSSGQILRTNGAGILSWVNDNSGAGAFSGTASRAVATDGAGALTTTVTTATEIGYVNGVTSSIQTQLNAKQANGNYVTALTGDVTATGPGSVAATVAQVGGVTAANVAAGANLANAATNLNTVNTIVKRDASGNFSAGTITATLNGTATNVSGTVSVANGGTGATALGLNNLLFGNGTSAVGTLPITVTPSVLLSAITTGAPTWTTSTTGNVLKGSVTGVEFGPIDASDLPAGTLSGSGTANYIPYYSAANTLANSPVAVSGANVGIGTTTPTSNLEIRNPSSSSILTLTSEIALGHANQIDFKRDGSTVNASIISKEQSNNDYANLQIWTRNESGLLERMRVTADGNVGIGATTPFNKLHVVGTTYSSAIIAGNWLGVGYGPGASQGNIYNRKMGIGSNSSTSYSSTSNAADSPFALSGGGGLILTNTSQDDNSQTTQEFSVVNTAGNQQLLYMGAVANTGAGVYSPTFILGQKTGTTSYAERMRIDGNGNVGIGTTTPGAPLDVKGAIRLSGSTSGYVGFQPAAAAGSTVWTLPAADGSSGQILRTNGAGILSWVNDNSGAGAFSGTASRAVATDGAGALTTTVTTATELGYVNGVTSSIQTQLNAKQANGNYVTALTGDVTATGPGSVAATVATVGGVTAANVAAGANLANAATNLNTASTIVKRDASGNFTAGTITATLNGTATNVSGTVSVANGGTGSTSLTLNRLLFGNGTSAIGTLATTATPSVLLSAVTTGAPTWTTSTTGNVLKGSVTGVEFGTLALSDLPAGTLSGSGTTNYIPYYSAASTLANSPIAVSGANIGIGTTSPQSNTHIHSGGGGAAIQFTDGTSGAASWSDGVRVSLGNSKDLNLTSNEANGNVNLTPGIGGYIIANGNVGIDMTPGAYNKLDVAGTIQGQGLQIKDPASLKSSNTMTNTIYGVDSAESIAWAIGDSDSSGQNLRLYGSSGYGLTFFSNASERMRIDSSGNVGIGTSSPGAKLDIEDPTENAHIRFSSSGTPLSYLSASGSSLLDVKDNGLTTKFTVTSSGNVGIGTTTPNYLALSGSSALTIAGDGSSSTAAGVLEVVNSIANGSIAAFDKVGSISFALPNNSGGANTKKMGEILMQTEGSGGANGYGSKMFFKTRADNSTLAATSRMVIDANGNVGIATSSPSYTLHVVGTAGLSTGTAWTNASDRRLKDIHGDYEYGLDEILKLHTVRYSYKKDNPLNLPSDFNKTGFIAQEVQKVIPDAVNVREDGYLELNVDPIHWAVVNSIKDLYKKYIMPLFESDKKQNREIASLKESNLKLQKENAEIKERLNRIEKMLSIKR